MEVKRLQSRPVRAEAPDVHGGLSAILLAAGAGRRFGGAKLRAPWRGEPLIHAALAVALAAPVEEVILVEGADPRAGELAQAYAEARGVARRLRRVVAEAWEEGLAASLRAGIASVPAGRRGAFVFLGDMPRTPRDLAACLAARLGPGIDAVAPEHGGELANPVLLAATLFPAVSELTGDRGARGLLEGLGPRLARVATQDDGVVLDVDTPAALQRLG